MQPSLMNQVTNQIQQGGDPMLTPGVPGYQPSMVQSSQAPMPDKSITSSYRKEEETPLHRALKRRGIQITPQMHAQIMATEAQMPGQNGLPVSHPVMNMPPNGMQNHQPQAPAQPSAPQSIPNLMATPQNKPSKPPTKVAEPERAQHQQAFMQTLERMLGKIV